jgi:hypothetical protein
MKKKRVKVISQSIKKCFEFQLRNSIASTHGRKKGRSGMEEKGRKTCVSGAFKRISLCLLINKMAYCLRHYPSHRLLMK